MGLEKTQYLECYCNDQSQFLRDELQLIRYLILPSVKLLGFSDSQSIKDMNDNLDKNIKFLEKTK